MGGDTCDSIVARHSTWMDLSDLYASLSRPAILSTPILTSAAASLAWNPAVGVNCTGLYYGYWYCVGIQPQTSDFKHHGNLAMVSPVDPEHSSCT